MWGVYNWTHEPVAIVHKRSRLISPGPTAPTHKPASVLQCTRQVAEDATVEARQKRPARYRRSSSVATPLQNMQEASANMHWNGVEGGEGVRGVEEVRGEGSGGG